MRYFYTRPDKEIVRKQVWFYLVHAEGGELKAQAEEILGVRWVPLADVKQELAYRNLQPVLGRAVRTINAIRRGEEDGIEQ